MSKSSSENNKDNRVVDLKFHPQRSHNQNSYDEHIIDLVRFLARRAAEEDFRKYKGKNKDASRSPDTNKGDI